MPIIQYSDCQILKGEHLVITTIWARLWSMHDEVKEMFRFFVKPNDSEIIKKSQQNEVDDMDSKNREDDEEQKPQYAKMIGLILGPLFFILILSFFRPADLSWEGVAILASTAWIATWWITEAVPIPVTSLLPIVLFPLTKGLKVKSTASAYGDDVIFLFMGGFMIALAMEKWNLHRRIALSIIQLVGTNTERIILGFMVATGFLSMWISNTATAMMMVPIGLAISFQFAEALRGHPDIDTREKHFPFGKALMLSIAYSASLGGIGTLIGTPPNALLAGAIDKIFGIEISFAQWMLFGVPFSWIFIIIVWLYLTKFAFRMPVKEIPGGREIIQKQKDELGKASSEEKLVLTIFVLAALSWITREFVLEKFIPEINDAIIAIIFGILLFIIPSPNNRGERLLDWDSAVKLPWGVLLLFGGGLAIAAGFVESGLSVWIGSQLSGLKGVSLILVIAIVVTIVALLTEVTSNTATATMMFPIMASLALALEVHPYALMIAAALAASCAFMMPVATPPNAVVFGSGYLRIPDMVKAGIYLTLFGILLITVFIYFWLPIAWGVDLHTVPEIFKQ